MRIVAWIRVLLFAAIAIATASAAAAGRVVLAWNPRLAARWAARCCQTWCAGGLVALGVRRRVVGRPPSGAFLAAANHLSYLDILVIGSLWPGVFVAKHEIAGWPLFGFAARAGGTIFIDRGSPREVVAAGREIRDRLDHGLAVTLFAEGRITSGERVLPFLASLLAPAARGRVPCHGVCLYYATDDPTIDPATQVCWPQDVPLIPHILRIAGLRDLRATVHVQESPVVDDDRKELAHVLHAWVEERFEPIRGAETETSCAR
jgi:1-acyl-sn-glycerol-3-phosphate acyltransferase